MKRFVIFDEASGIFLTDPYERTVEMYDDAQVAARICESHNDDFNGFVLNDAQDGLIPSRPWAVFELVLVPGGRQDEQTQGPQGPG